MDTCFVPFNNKSTIRKELLELCEKNSDWIDPIKGTFFQKKPPKELIYKDTFLEFVCKNYLLEDNFDDSVTIFLLRPWTHYMMHMDRFRKSSINMLINDYSDSIAYFQVSAPYNSLHIDIKELQYEIDTYYLFNSRMPHAVTNKSIPRYLLSITLNDSFENLKSSFQNQLFL